MHPRVGCHGTGPHQLRRFVVQSFLPGSFLPQGLVNALIRMSGQCLLLNLHRFRFVASLREHF